jgi:hypothetical protein
MCSLRPAFETLTVQDDTDAEWVPETQLDTLDRAKLLALRIFTHRALAETTFALLRAALVGKEEEENLDDDERDSRLVDQVRRKNTAS